MTPASKKTKPRTFKVWVPQNNDGTPLLTHVVRTKWHAKTLTLNAPFRATLTLDPPPSKPRRRR